VPDNPRAFFRESGPSFATFVTGVDIIAVSEKSVYSGKPSIADENWT
jgi:hypothetical protein